MGILIFGLIMVYSSSFIFAHERAGDGFIFIKRQIAYALVGIGLMILVSRLHYGAWIKLAYPLSLFSIFILALVLIPGLGSKVGGAQRWLSFFGFRFQPGEIVKLLLIVFSASQLYRKQSKLSFFSAGVFAQLFIPMVCFGLLLAQPDFGTTAIVGFIIFLLMFLAGVHWKYLIALMGLGSLGLVTLLLSAPYRLNRLLAFLDPWKDPMGRGFQVIQSFLGFNNGEIVGVGLGNGKEKLFFLPEAHNDFIFSVIGEELGFVGVLALTAVFTFLMIRGFQISWQVLKEKEDYFGFYLGVGLTLYLCLQAFFNMAVSLGLLPTKGMTLPFVSYGGTALVMNLFSVGILLSISRHTRLATRSLR